MQTQGRRNRAHTRGCGGDGHRHHGRRSDAHLRGRGGGQGEHRVELCHRRQGGEGAGAAGRPRGGRAKAGHHQQEHRPKRLQLRESIPRPGGRRLRPSQAGSRPRVAGRGEVGGDAHHAGAGPRDGADSPQAAGGLRPHRPCVRGGGRVPRPCRGLTAARRERRHSARHPLCDRELLRTRERSRHRQGGR